MAGPSPFARSVSSALHVAPAVSFPASTVRDLLEPAAPADATFARVFEHGLPAVARELRGGRLNGLTGHVGESLVEVILDEAGCAMLWHFTGPLSGGHGVDLLTMSADGCIVAVEVKSTLRPRRWPRPTRGELDQMSEQWLDRADNPGMANWDLSGQDVYGLVVVVNFAERAWRAAGSADFTTAFPVVSVDDLADVSGWQALALARS